MKLTYKGFDRAGQPVTDSVDARDIADATEMLRRQGVYLTEIHAADAAAAPKMPSVSAFGKGRRLKHVAMFMRQLHVLVATGTPVAESLIALERQSKDEKWKAVVTDIKTKVEQGASLSSAMAAHPRYFNAICRGLVAAGESGGNLDVMLERLSVLSRKQVHVRASVIGAMIYPALLTVVAVGVLVTLMIFVLPRFSALFLSLDTPLPPTTKFLMALSDITRTYWWTSPIILGAGGFGAWTMLKTPTGKRGLDRLIISAPQFGLIVRSFETAKITRLLGILLHGRVPLLEALDLTRDSTSNFYYTQLLTRASDAITRGDSLAGAFADPRLIAPSVCEAVRSGEKSGQLGTLLSTIADFLDEENDVTLRSLTSIIEPIILIILGVMVGFIALSMFMPLFDLTSATGAK
ncbi:MAG TPA: type II secretion system F family protein [Tepidisphaeraceae bacterium]|jgi:type II secretory pathway component PulF